MVDIGIIGTGLMGHAFVERFLSQGFTVRVFNRTRDNIKELAESGVVVCSTADELVRLSSTIILMVSDAAAINSLLQLDTEKDLQGKYILQMATISPSQSKDIGETISSCGGSYLEAPVLGSIPEAKTGTLIIMAGGSKDLFE